MAVMGVGVSLRERIASHGARISVAWMLATGTWAALHGLTLLGPLESQTFNVLAAATFIAAVAGIWLYRPALQLAWLGIAAATGLFVIGGIARQHYATFGNLTSSRSLLPDLITLPGYALLAAGLGTLVLRRRRGRRGNFDALIDSMIAGLAALSLAWVFLITPTISNAGTPLAVRLVLSCYPAMSVFLLAIAARMAFSPATRRVPAFWLLLGTLGFTLVGDTVYMLLELGKITTPLWAIDLPYALGYVALGGALLHPSMRQLSEPAPAEEQGTVRGRLAVVEVALAIPAIVMFSKTSASATDRVVLSTIVALLTGLAIWRMWRALREHARVEAALVHQATHDALTGLPNRMVAEQRVATALRTSAFERRQVALLFLDVDRFKLVNDTVGHALGDDLLVEVARRIKATVRHDDLVARTGGDEFVVVLEHLTEEAEGVDWAERIRGCFASPFLVRGNEIYSSASVGVVVADGRDRTVDFGTMIRDADTAMYQVKEAGRDGIAVFDASMRDRAAERVALEHDLRSGIERGEVTVHYQPIMALPHGPAVGVEALVRWTHPRFGEIPPSKFVPIAEESGLIEALGALVLTDACQSLAHWRLDVPAAAELYVCVNVSARQLRDPTLPDQVRTALAENGLPAQALCLELTESILMENLGEAERLNELRDLGVRLSIDDFGTGYSSLSYLKRFPLDYVKIDRAFVEGLDRPHTSDESLVAAIVAMTRAMGMLTIGEGVQTAAQERRLIELGCDAAQGYRYSRAVPADEVPAMLRRALKPFLRPLRIA
jgi:diguanylate cyclase (GGDEF)-like protein